MKLFKFIALILCTAAFAASVKAQSNGRAVFQVPFDFVAREQKLPAGKYSFRRFNSDNPDALLLENSNGTTRMIFLTTRFYYDRPKNEWVLSFRRIGDSYFLSELRSAESGYGNRFLPDSFWRKRKIKVAETRTIRTTGN